MRPPEFTAAQYVDQYLRADAGLPQTTEENTMIQSSNTGRWNVETNTTQPVRLSALFATGLQNAEFTVAGFRRPRCCPRSNTYYTWNASVVFADQVPRRR